MESVIEPLRLIDWNDAQAVERGGEQAFAAFAADPEIVRKALFSLPERPDLMRLSEHHDLFDKIILHDDPASGLRVRLHIFQPGFIDPPHNHRWSFASMILHGGYKHSLYGDVEQVMRSDPASLRALLVREERAGSVYALHHAMVHRVESGSRTVSLLLRGPAVKDRHVVLDGASGPTWWQRGTSPEAARNLVSRELSPDRLAELHRLAHGPGPGRELRRRTWKS